MPINRIVIIVLIVFMAEVSIIYKLYDFVTSSVTNIQKNIGSLNSTITKATAYFDDLGKRAFIFNQLSQAAQSFNQVISNINKPALVFEQQIADLQALTGIVGKELDELGNTAKKLGVQSGLGASQAIEAYKLLASNIDITTIGGIDGLKKLANETIMLAKASGVDLPTAANTMASAINQFGLSADDASRVINVLGAGAKYGAAEIPDLADALKLAGTTAAQSGISIEGAVGALEILSQNAIKGSEAGTALRNIMLKMRKELGIDFTKLTFAEALQQLKPQLQDVNFLTKTFGLENVNAAQVLIANAAAVDEMINKVTNTNVAYEQAAIRSDTYAEKMAKIKAVIDNVKISLFNATGIVLPFTQVFTEYFTGFAQLAPGIILVKDAIIWLTKAQHLYNVVQTITIAATKIWTGVQWLLNAAFIASPIGWIVLAIGALIAAVIIAYNKFEGFRKIITATWSAIRGFGRMLYTFFIDGVITAIKGIGKLGEAVSKLFRGDFKGAWTSAAGAAKDLTGFTTAKKLINEAKELGGKVTDAYNKGTQAKPIKNPLEGVINKKEIAPTKTTGAFDINQEQYQTKTTAPGVSEVMSASPRVFNLNIEKLIERFEVSATTIRESSQQIRDIVLKALIEAINDSQMAAV